MSLKELDITPGLETQVWSNIITNHAKVRTMKIPTRLILPICIVFKQVAVTPVLYSTTDAARSRFGPVERGCYFEGELSLAYLPKVIRF